MVAEDDISRQLADLKEISPSGYAIALHIQFTTPMFLFQTYPKPWLSYYSENGLVMQDPTVRWGFENEGWVPWSELTGSDPAGVIEAAAKHGMTHGLTCAVAVDEDRSIASFSRHDRPFTDEEAATILTSLSDLHQATGALQSLSPETAARLHQLSVQVTHPND